MTQLRLLEDEPSEQPDPGSTDDFLTLVYHPRFRNLQRNSTNAWTVYVLAEDETLSLQQGSGRTPAEAMYKALNQGNQ